MMTYWALADGHEVCEASWILHGTTCCRRCSLPLYSSGISESCTNWLDTHETFRSEIKQLKDQPMYSDMLAWIERVLNRIEKEEWEREVPDLWQNPSL